MLVYRNNNEVAGVIDGEVIVTGVTDQAYLREMGASQYLWIGFDCSDIIGQRVIKCVSKRTASILVM